MLKKSFSLLVAVIMIATAMAVLIPAGVSADEAAKQLPANAVYVDPAIILPFKLLYNNWPFTQI